MYKIEEFKNLSELLDQGAITEKEFNALIYKHLAEQSNHSDHILQKLNKRITTLRNWSLLLSVLLFMVLFVIGTDNYDVIKNTILMKRANSMTKDGNGNSINKDIIYQNGKEIGRIVKRDFNPNSGSKVTTMNIPIGKMWTPLYFEFVNGKPSYFEVHIYPFERTNGWADSDSYIFVDSKHLYVSIKYAKQYYKPMTSKTNPAIHVSANVETACTVYFFEESTD